MGNAIFSIRSAQLRAWTPQTWPCACADPIVFSPCHLFACSDIPARALEVEKYAWLIADNPCIMSWWGNTDITWPKIVYGTIVQHCAKVPGNDIGKMGSLATLRSCDGS